MLNAMNENIHAVAVVNIKRYIRYFVFSDSLKNTAEAAKQGI
jgi:hypothetical protein